jgi:hypothetical protein
VDGNGVNRPRLTDLDDGRALATIVSAKRVPVHMVMTTWRGPLIAEEGRRYR